MIRLLVIEDETVIRNGLMKHVPWERIGIGMVKMAANAEEALALCQVFPPDIIISDIRMPGMDGVALCRKLRGQFADAEIIFVTGYADKEYLIAAIDLHAVRYIEKPIQIGEISEAVKEAVVRVGETRRKKEIALREIFLDSSASSVGFRGCNVFCAGMLHLKEGAGGVFPAKEKIADCLRHTLDGQGIRFLSEVLDSAAVGYLFGSSVPICARREVLVEIEENVRACMGARQWFLTFGKDVEDFADVRDSWEEARHAQRALAFLGWDHAVLPGELSDGNHQGRVGGQAAERFANAVMARKKKEALGILMDVFREFREKQAFMDGNIRYGCTTLARTLLELGNSPSADLDIDFFEQAETFAEIYEYLKERLEQVLEDREQGKNSYVVARVKEYILDRYGDSSLSIKDLAEHVYLTPTYLSNLFKKNTGVTIGQFLVDVRISRAKELMRDPQLKFYQVASMVGYEDSGYFAKIFKKHTGTTPSEYKESLR